MSLSRRRLFQRFGSAPLNGEWIAARGREAAVAEGSLEFAQQQRAARQFERHSHRQQREPSRPRAARHRRHRRQVPRSGPLPVQRPRAGTRAGQGAGQQIRRGRQPDCRSGPGSGEILIERGARVHVAEQAAGDAVADASRTRATRRGRSGPKSARSTSTRNLRIDIDKLVEASKGAGLVFFCNPNNPTATVHGAPAVADFVKRVRAASPDTVILIDEAYHDYVTDPAYKTAMDIAKSTPKVFVAADLLEGLRHGRPARRLRRRRRRSDQAR